jgi:ethanolamine ammonia-lyase small subunit
MNELDRSADSLARQMQSATPARVALGRAGNALPTREVLRFAMDHAKARDAVHCMLDAKALLEALPAPLQNAVPVQSRAASREEYLLRPDFGRRLRVEDAASLQAQSGPAGEGSDLCLVVADGLSALAVQSHAPPLLAALLPLLPPQWKLAPLVIAQQARVALGDEIAVCLQAKMVAVLIGERPGLSSPDSLGIYLTWQPAIGMLDSSRNCISNVRAQGLKVEDAAARLAWLLRQARERQASGIALKDESAPPAEKLL